MKMRSLCSIAPVFCLVAACRVLGTIAPEQREPISSTFAVSGVPIAYTIDFPSGRGPFPAVVLVHGSGRTTRDDISFLADKFRQRGFATLRFDKRGVGASGGEYRGIGPAASDSLLRVLALDVNGALTAIRGAPGIDAARVGLAGGSQAGWIIPISAVTQNVKFCVILSGPTVSVGREVFYSSLAENTTLPLDSVAIGMRGFSSTPGFDPISELRKMNVPALWVFGLSDRSIPAGESIDILRSLPQYSSKLFAIQTYPDLGHGLGDEIWPDIFRWLDPIVPR